MTRKIQLPELLVQLPTPQGEEIRALIDRKHWTLREFAEITGLSDQRQTLKYIKRENGLTLNNLRWTMALLAAGEHPTLKLTPIGESMAPEQKAT